MRIALDARRLRPMLGALIASALGAPPGAVAGESCAEIPLIRYERDGCGQGWGGEIRQRYEYARNPGLGAEPQDARGVWLQRWALHGAARVGERARVFVELHSALEAGRAAGAAAVDENELEFQNAFGELRLPLVDDREALVRIGRQELELGSARLVSVREGPNVRRTFDGIRVTVHSRRWQFDALAVRPRADRHGAFDDETDDDRSLWGLYATRRSVDESGASGLDLYALSYSNDVATYAQGSGKERRHTLGARFFGSRGGWSWNWEPMVQFGELGEADLRAWTLASETGYEWANAPLRPRVALSANIASGDRNPLDPDLETFNPLFPRGNYFSEDSILGPYNFYNAHVFLTLKPRDSWRVTLDHNMFWRLSTDDGIYGPSGRLIRAGLESRARFVATGTSLTSSWSAGRHWSFDAKYTRFAPRRFLRETGPAEAVDFVQLTARLRF